MVYLAIVSLVWAFSFGLIGSALAGVDPFFVATLRLVCATLLFLPFLRFGKIARKDCGKLMTYGSIQFGLMYSSYMKAFAYLPSHLVALFSILTPVYVVLISDFKQRKLSPIFLLAASLSVIGAAFIRAESVPRGNFWVGFGLMQLSGFSFAYGQVAYREWKRRHQSVNDREVFSLVAVGGVVSALLFSLIFTNWNELPTNSTQWVSVLYLGLVASGLGFFFGTRGRLSATRVLLPHSTMRWSLLQF